ncbi:hypothetical protein [Enterovibrio paralichthyis]|uniref:hypothetical protein n=1 Tax=Enterovibrio paralichthyis TaxID=2853805 RepID=UPI001C46E2F1|nr:hypothetical protein [Enterovibrio paralichthyis]MBV7299149.1 hypothetical protein [Enterovibrio paralichthyis]
MLKLAFSLVPEQVDSKFVCKQASLLDKKFDWSKNKDVERALSLFSYLHALNKNALAIEIIEAFVDDMGEKNRGFQLYNKLSVVALLAYLLDEEGRAVEAQLRVEQYADLAKRADYDFKKILDDMPQTIAAYYEQQWAASQFENDNTKREDIDGCASNIVIVLEYFAPIKFLCAGVAKTVLHNLEEILIVEKEKLSLLL